MILSALIVKVAFIYVDTKKFDHMKDSIRPTYRISMQVSPEIKKPVFSVALSDVSKTGVIKPLVIAKVRM